VKLLVWTVVLLFCVLVWASVVAFVLITAGVPA
jgi:hypothetical protein